MYIILNYMHTEINRCLHPFWLPNQERNKSSLDGVLSHVTWRGLSEDAMQRYYLRVYSFTDQTNLSQVCLAFSLFYQRISSAFSYKKQVTGNESQYENRKEKHSQTLHVDQWFKQQKDICMLYVFFETFRSSPSSWSWFARSGLLKKHNYKQFLVISQDSF